RHAAVVRPGDRRRTVHGDRDVPRRHLRVLGRPGAPLPAGAGDRGGRDRAAARPVPAAHRIRARATGIPARDRTPGARCAQLHRRRAAGCRGGAAMIARILPYPLLSAVLALVWMVLNQSMAPGTILLGALLGVVLAR